MNEGLSSDAVTGIIVIIILTVLPFIAVAYALIVTSANKRRERKIIQDNMRFYRASMIALSPEDKQKVLDIYDALIHENDEPSER